MPHKVNERPTTLTIRDEEDAERVKQMTRKEVAREKEIENLKKDPKLTNKSLPPAKF